MGLVIWFGLTTACLWGAYLWGYRAGAMEQEMQQAELLHTWPRYSVPRQGDFGWMVKWLTFVVLMVVVMIIFSIYT